MRATDLISAAKQWVPFTVRTMAYGTASIVLGPFTAERRASLWAMREWSKASAEQLHMDLQVKGLENVPSGAFVYASNHQSMLDILALGAVLPGNFKWAAKSSLMRVPFLGWHLKLAGHVPVERGGGPKAAAEVTRRFELVLREGKPLLVFPEGTRTDDGHVKPFKAGVFFAAARVGVPVVPVAIEGTFSFMQKGAAHAGEHEVRKVRVSIGAPIVANLRSTEAARIEELRARAHEAVLALHDELVGRRPREERERPVATAPAA